MAPECHKYYIKFYFSHWANTVRAVIFASCVLTVLFIIIYLLEENTKRSLSTLAYEIKISFLTSTIVFGFQFLIIAAIKYFYINAYARENNLTMQEVHRKGAEYLERIWAEED